MGKRAEKSSLFPAGCQENGTGLNFAGAAAVASCPFDYIYPISYITEEGTLFYLLICLFIRFFEVVVCNFLRARGKEFSMFTFVKI